MLFLFLPACSLLGWLPQNPGFPGDTVVKNLLANAVDTGDAGSILGLGRSHGGGNGSILAWRIPWIEEPGGLQSMGPQRVGHS